MGSMVMYLFFFQLTHLPPKVLKVTYIAGNDHSDDNIIEKELL